MGENPTDLGELEHEVMQIVWASETITSEAVRERLFREITTRAPWCTALDTGERRCLLGLMRKMLRARSGR